MRVKHEDGTDIVPKNENVFVHRMFARSSGGFLDEEGFFHLSEKSTQIILKTKSWLIYTKNDTTLCDNFVIGLIHILI